MARVTGIGGVFLRSRDPKALTKWYSETLGIALNDWGGIVFEWKDDVPAGTGMTTWSAFKADSDYFGDLQQQAMVNYRVDDLDGVLAKLEASGAWIDPKRDDQDYGRFAWAKDPDGNRFELWQPM